MAEHKLKKIKDETYSILLKPIPIGAGKFGEVFEASLEFEPEKKFAIKQIKKNVFLKNEKFQETLKRELSLIKNVDHDNLMKHYHTMETANNYYLILEFCEQGSLETFLEKKPGKYIKDDEEAFDLINQVTQGMYYLYKNNIIHRDLKPENILISSANKIKIADFGFARFLDSEFLNVSCQFTNLGTPFYMAPEVLKGDKSSSKCDVWACGVIFYELLYGCYPYREDKNTIKSTIELHEIFNKKNLKFPEQKRSSPCFDELLKRMLDPIHKDRATWDEVSSILIEIKANMEAKKAKDKKKLKEEEENKSFKPGETSFPEDEISEACINQVKIKEMVFEIKGNLFMRGVSMNHLLTPTASPEKKIKENFSDDF